MSPTFAFNPYAWMFPNFCVKFKNTTVNKQQSDYSTVATGSRYYYQASIFHCFCAVISLSILEDKHDLVNLVMEDFGATFQY